MVRRVGGAVVGVRGLGVRLRHYGLLRHDRSVSVDAVFQCWAVSEARARRGRRWFIGGEGRGEWFGVWGLSRRMEGLGSWRRSDGIDDESVRWVVDRGTYTCRELVLGCMRLYCSFTSVPCRRNRSYGHDTS